MPPARRRSRRRAVYFVPFLNFPTRLQAISGTTNFAQTDEPAHIVTVSFSSPLLPSPPLPHRSLQVLPRPITCALATRRLAFHQPQSHFSGMLSVETKENGERKMAVLNSRKLFSSAASRRVASRRRSSQSTNSPAVPRRVPSDHGHHGVSFERLFVDRAFRRTEKSSEESRRSEKSEENCRQ